MDVTGASSLPLNGACFQSLARNHHVGAAGQLVQNSRNVICPGETDRSFDGNLDYSRASPKCFPVTLSLYTVPPFITNPTFSSTFTSCSGSALTAIRSAYLPASILPTSLLRPIRSAALTVAARIAWIGVMPHSTILPNCLPLSPCG